jgi:selenocysteine lyase/cysteine desulfurase
VIACQRHLFDIPEGVTWLNCAQHAPATNAVYQAGLRGLERKRHPWTLSAEQYYAEVEALRRTFARLVSAQADDVAFVPAVSYGLAVAAKNLDLPAGGRVLVLADQFPSNVYAWRALAARHDGEVVTLARPVDGDWTRCIEAALDERTAILAIPQFHWMDGTRLAVERLAPQVRAVGAALVLDLSQSMGAVPADLPAIDPDFAVAVGYKWLLGPYRFTFLYAAPRRQRGEPLEQAWSSRADSEDGSRLTDYRDEMAAGARRYDVGERGDYLAVPMAQAALDQILAWGVGEISDSLAPLVAEIASQAEVRGIGTTPAPYRAPHFIGLRLDPPPPRDLLRRLGEEGLHISLRGETLRVSPHLYNDKADIARLFEGLDRHPRL